jgi:hypothetical protein
MMNPVGSSLPSSASFPAAKDSPEKFSENTENKRLSNKNLRVIYSFLGSLLRIRAQVRNKGVDIKNHVEQKNDKEIGDKQNNILQTHHYKDANEACSTQGTDKHSEYFQCEKIIWRFAIQPPGHHTQEIG